MGQFRLDFGEIDERFFGFQSTGFFFFVPSTMVTTAKAWEHQKRQYNDLCVFRASDIRKDLLRIKREKEPRFEDRSWVFGGWEGSETGIPNWSTSIEV